MTERHLDTLIEDTNSALELLASLSESFRGVEEQTSTFQSQCEDLLSEQRRLEKLADEVGTDLHYYAYIDNVTRRLNAPGAGRQVEDESFGETMQNLDACIAFMEKNVSAAPTQPTDGESFTLTRTAHVPRRRVLFGALPVPAHESTAPARGRAAEPPGQGLRRHRSADCGDAVRVGTACARLWSLRGDDARLVPPHPQRTKGRAPGLRPGRERALRHQLGDLRQHGQQHLPGVHRRPGPRPPPHHPARPGHLQEGGQGRLGGDGDPELCQAELREVLQRGHALRQALRRRAALQHRPELGLCHAQVAPADHGQRDQRRPDREQPAVGAADGRAADHLQHPRMDHERVSDFGLRGGGVCLFEALPGASGETSGRAPVDFYGQRVRGRDRQIHLQGDRSSGSAQDQPRRGWCRVIQCLPTREAGARITSDV